MLKRELLRIAVIGGIGVLVSIIVMLSKNEINGISPIVIPFYLIGICYGAKIIIKLLGKIVKVFFSFQFMSLLINPLVGTVLCLSLLVVSVFCLISLGWIIGLIKCIYCLYNAHQMDKQCIEVADDFNRYI